MYEDVTGDPAVLAVLAAAQRHMQQTDAPAAAAGPQQRFTGGLGVPPPLSHGQAAAGYGGFSGQAALQPTLNQAAGAAGAASRFGGGGGGGFAAGGGGGGGYGLDAETLAAAAAAALEAAAAAAGLPAAAADWMGPAR
jgi:hypothetical protein